MRHFVAAIQFITVIPLGWHGKYEPTKMIPYFPVVGLLLGFLTAVFDHIALQIWPAPIVAVLDVIVLIALTGALHLDGLGDTADGLFSHRSREQALAIMKDSRIGVMGLVAIVCVVAVKGTSLAELDTCRSVIILIIPAYARSSILFAIHFLPYGRPEGGTGKDFFTESMKVKDFRLVVLPVILSAMLGRQAIILNLGFMGIVAVTLLFYKRKMNAVTGDMIGALIEVTEAGLFLAMAIRMFQ